MSEKPERTRKPSTSVPVEKTPLCTHFRDMLLVETTMQDKSKSFGMIALTSDCPYVEVVYDPTAKMLAVVTKDKSDRAIFVNKLDAGGKVVLNRDPKTSSVLPLAQERKFLQAFQELHLSNKIDIVNLIKLKAINADSFDYEKYIVE